MSTQSSSPKRSSGGNALVSVGLTLLTAAVIAVVVLVIVDNSANATKTVQFGKVKPTLTAAQSHGRQVFAETCSGCHTLAAANANGQVGPNLDQLKPNAALVAATAKNGFQGSQGVMPAGLVTGEDAADVADFVGAVTNPR